MLTLRVSLIAKPSMYIYAFQLTYLLTKQNFMKKFNILFALVAFLMASSSSVNAQVPFLDETYDVKVTESVIYGFNATILPVIAQQSAEALPRPLVMDVYEPVGDNADASRPVMLVYHTGNFLPFPTNNGTGGTIKDLSVVEVCTRLAKRGYIAAAVDYRLGWNPIAPTQDERKFFLINAAYRGVQDARTAVRWFRKNARDEGNTYNIDDSKIGQWGIGTGGYIAAGVATIDAYAELAIPKFFTTIGGQTVPMVLEGVNGNINGTSVGIVPEGYPVLPAGDTLNYPNNVVYADGTEISSEIAFTVNNGGALGEIDWIDGNEAPWVSFHVPEDPFAPYTTGVLTVPGTGDPDDTADDFAVVEVSGSYDIQAKLNDLGVNDAFEGAINETIVDFEEVANSRNDGLNGLFPFTADVSTSAPWDLYSPDNPNAPAMDDEDFIAMEDALLAWDTIFAYASPRACIALGLGCEMATDIEEVQDASVFGLAFSPNPAVNAILVEANSDASIQDIELFDLSGKLVQRIAGINNNQAYIKRNNLPAGIYVTKVRFEEGIVTQKVVFK